MFITDKHKRVEKAIVKVDPNVYHENWKYYLNCNVKQHFSKNKIVFMSFIKKIVSMSFYWAIKAFLWLDFDEHMKMLENINIHAP